MGRGLAKRRTHQCCKHCAIAERRSSDHYMRQHLAQHKCCQACPSPFLRGSSTSQQVLPDQQRTSQALDFDAQRIVRAAAAVAIIGAAGQDCQEAGADCWQSMAGRPPVCLCRGAGWSTAPTAVQLPAWGCTAPCRQLHCTAPGAGCSH